MAKEGSNAWYRAYADRFYLDKANKDLYLYRSSSSKLGLNCGLVVPALETIDGVDVSVHAADIDAHMTDNLQTFRTGEYVIPGSYSIGAITITANRLHVIPLIVVRAMTIDRIATMVTTGASAKSARMGIYNDGVNLYPGTLLQDLGTVSVASTGIQAITIDPALSLTKGIYWLALVSDGTPGIRGHGIKQEILGYVATDFSLHYYGWYVAFTYAALPDPFPASASQMAWSDNPPSMRIRLESLD